jgi:pimeloyl-ACP methyl ester carboxylesterase
MTRVVFIHGMFVTPRCWSGWMERFGARGLSCVAPPWPGREATPAELRARHPDPAVGALTFDALVQHWEAIVRAEPEPPVLVGHSLGGLLVQLLVSRGLGARGVAINSAPPKGVMVFKWSQLRSNFPLFFGSKPFLMNEKQWHYAFTNTFTPEETHDSYERQCVPESKRVGRGTLGKAAALDWKKPHAPLLFLSGGADHIIPPAVNLSNIAKYKDGGSRRDHKLFDGRTHYTILDGAGWTDVADYVADWIQRS